MSQRLTSLLVFTILVCLPALQGRAAPINISGGGTTTLSGNTTIDGASNWTNENLDLSGFTLTQDPGGTMDFHPAHGTNPQNPQVQGSGTIRNRAGATWTIRTESGAGATFSRQFAITGPSTFLNEGLFNFGSSPGSVEHQIRIENAGAVFTNAAGAVIENSSSRDAAFGATASAGTFNNLGTVRVTNSQLSINTGNSGLGAVTVPQFSGSTLTGGTWEASGTGTLNVAGVSNVATIGPAANVILGDSGSFNRVANSGSALTTVQGGFYVNGSKTFTPSGALAVNSSGTIGGTGTVAGTVNAAGTVSPAAESIGSFTIADLNVNGGTLRFDVSDLNGIAGTDFDQLIVSNVLDLSGGGSFLVGGTPGDGNFQAEIVTAGSILGFDPNNFSLESLGGFGDYSVIQIGNSLFLQPAPLTPEPASLALWGFVGLAAFGAHRYRRR